jgi:hypothetical protein
VKRSTLVKLLIPIISQKDTPESVRAELVIKQLEELKLLNPTHKVSVTKKDIELMPYEIEVSLQGWEDE